MLVLASQFTSERTCLFHNCDSTISVKTEVAMINVNLALLPLFVVLMAVAYRRTRHEGSPPPSARERVLFGLVVLAVVIVGVGFGSAAQLVGRSPANELVEVSIVLLAIAFAPLGFFLACDYPLRLVRRWEAGRASHGSVIADAPSHGD